MDPLQFIKKFRFVEKSFGPDDNELTTHWMRWDREGWKILNGPNGHGRNWDRWSQNQWDNKLIERLWELRKYICDNLELHEFQVNTITVSPLTLMILEAHPTLDIYPGGIDGETTYILGGSFVVEVNYQQDNNRVYLGSIENHIEGCILIDNYGTE